MDKNNYKNFLRDKHNELPENLSWDKVEAGIQSRLGVLEASSKNTFWKKIRSLAVLFLGLLIGACLINQCYFNNPNPSDKSTEILPQNNTVITKKNIQDNNEIPSKEAKLIQLKEQQKSQQKEITSLAQTATIETAVSNKNIKIGEKTNESKLTKTNLTQTEIEINNYNSTYGANRVINNNSIINTTKSAPALNVTDKKEIGKGLNGAVSFKKESVLSKAFLPISSLLQSIPTENRFLSPTNAKAFIKKDALGSTWSIGLSSGVIFWNPSFEGQMIGQHKAQTEKALISHGSHFNVSLLLNDKWEISSGLSFAQRNSRLQFSGVKDTTVSVNRDVTLVNPNTGNAVGQQSMNLDASAQISRNVIHHNSYQQWSIPLYLSRNWLSDRRFAIKTGAGIEYAFSGTAKGVTMNLLQGETTVWPSTILEDEYQVSNSLSVLGNVELQYQLNSKFSITSTIRGSRSLTNLDTRVGETFRPSSLYLSAGLNYRL